MKKLVIGVHPNEGTMREPNPHVPWTPEEIADDTAAAREAGAAVVHFHARTATGGVDHTPETYGKIMAAIRDRCDILLAPTLANAPEHTLAQRLANVVENAADPRTRTDFLVAEMGCAVMDLWDPQARRFTSENRLFLNDTATQRSLLAKAAELGMTPWLPTFNVSWTRALTAHLDSGAVAGRAVVHLILGGPEFPAAHPATVEGLRAHLDFLPAGHEYEWFVSAYRGDVLAVAEEAIRRGGHVSIGVGDHHYAHLGLPTNAELVRRVAELSRRIGREVATPAEARRLLCGGHDTAEC
ncbi:3-keto-5-aminohexanoate cleavage protein [Acrocarpospora macrocephala]|uniref:3-keto-5-aminohexanoate cleavage protein n=1 Tax=Acrocarpospora macrocephala TaxID=150177 RepID=A0A5M3WLD8_9ACTN|nr:3-keto-5-aminohexanoate cleavage protein [Acrocarpospora macrocephala]GES09466.1 3-keto-5-aminohexanoate cleavage protein [Acrocarpospora macrocephala]